MTRTPSILALAVLLFGCSETTLVNRNDSPTVLEPGSIKGRVCDPSGLTWLSDALVYTHLYDENGKLYDTRMAYSDRDGYWMLADLPEGILYDIYVQWGSDILETYEVKIVADTVYKLDEPQCFDPLEMDVAIITGDYDDFHLVLNDLGFANYELIDGLTESEVVGFLTSPADMARYDMIFFNGGHVEEDVFYAGDGSDSATVDEIRTNIKDYVEDGGMLYGSDWSYDVIEATWPQRIDFVGDDNTPDDAQKGEYDYITAAVTDATLGEFLGKNYVEIEYDLPVWPPIESVHGATSTHLTGSVQYRIGTAVYTLPSSPILVSFSAGNGRVFFSTFRVAKNATNDMLLTLQYAMYSL